MGYAIQHTDVVPKIVRPESRFGMAPQGRKYELYFPVRIGPYDQIAEVTSPSAVIRSTALPALSVVEQVRIIESRLGLNRSQLALALGVTRKTIYDWLNKGANLSDPRTEKRMSSLYDIAWSQADETIGKFIGMNLQRPVSDKKSFLDILSDVEINVPLAKTVLETVVDLAMASKKRLEAASRKRPSQLPDYQAEATLEQIAPRT